jgi:hypothetical protein
VDSRCIHLNNDARAAMCCDLTASEMGGGAAAALPGLGAGGCSLMPSPAWRMRPSERRCRGSEPGPAGNELRLPSGTRPGTRWCGPQRSRPPGPRPTWWRRPSKRRAAVGGRSSRAFFCALCTRSRPSGRRAWTPCSSISSERYAANSEYRPVRCIYLIQIKKSASSPGRARWCGLLDHHTRGARHRLQKGQPPRACAIPLQSSLAIPLRQSARASHDSAARASRAADTAISAAAIGR